MIRPSAAATTFSKTPFELKLWGVVDIQRAEEQIGVGGGGGGAQRRWRYLSPFPGRYVSGVYSTMCGVVFQIILIFIREDVIHHWPPRGKLKQKFERSPSSCAKCQFHPSSSASIATCDSSLG